MRRILASLLMMLILAAPAMAQTAMSDAQVIQYIQQAQSQGKSQTAITTELLQKGVTRDQLMRIQASLKDSDGAGATGSTQLPQDSRMRKITATPAAQNPRTAQTDQTQAPTILYDAMGNPVVVPSPQDQRQNAHPETQVFGQSVFSTDALSFEPNQNIATPEDYRLGPGDEVIIDIWGASENTIREQISPDGNINISGLGPLHIAGMTIKDATSYAKSQLSKIYSGIGQDDSSSQFTLTLGNLRSIQVSVMGEVEAPGTYTLSSMATVFHALYSAGGIGSIGSLRSVKVIRGGREVANADIYGYLIQGKTQSDIRLQENDVIIVSPSQNMVQVTGKIKRPMFYELKKGETVKDLLDFSGGFTGDAYKKSVRLIRKSGVEFQVFNVDEMDYSVFKMDDGDQVYVDSVLSRFENRIEVYGAVYRPGLYQLNGSVSTLKQLIKKAEGLRGDAFLSRVLINREKEDLSHEMLSVDLTDIMNGGVVDIPLKRNDIIFIPSIHDIQEQRTVSIRGEVGTPGTYEWSENMTAEDLVILAGGLLEDAATVNVEVTRRVKDQASEQYSEVLGQSFSIDLSKDLKPQEGNFRLEPFDEVYIRKSPTYHTQTSVTINGEVLFEGTYALNTKSERLSDLIQRAGGLTKDAYIKGARLVRGINQDERLRRIDAALAEYHLAGNDSITAEEITVEDTYTVGINLEKALQNPGSDWDMVLQENDLINIPEYINTVSISGAVRYPNTVVYQDNKSLKHYIEQAGGYANNAKKSKVYSVNLNGTVSLLKSGSKKQIEPGCEIIVPEKDPDSGMNMQQILSIGTMTASLAAVVASIIRLIK